MIGTDIRVEIVSVDDDGHYLPQRLVGQPGAPVPAVASER